MIRPLLFLALVLTLSSTSESRGQDKKEPPSKEVKLTAEEFAAEVAANKAKVAVKYKNKQLVISGEVAERDDGFRVVILKGKRPVNVICDFGEDRKDQVAACKAGDKVTIRGMFLRVGGLGHVELHKCEVVK